MTTTLSEGVKVPDVGSVNWAGDLEVNWNLLNGALANLSGNVKLDRDNIWTGEQSFTLPIVGSITGTASKAIADEDGTSIKSGYVNVAGNQTVTGQKTWSGNQFFTSPMYPKNTSYEIGNTPASNVAIPIYFTDKNNAHTGYVRNVILATGKTQSELLARNKFTSGALDPSGTDVSSTLQVEVQPTGTKTIYWDGLIRNDVTPFTTDNNSLGSSTNQWSSVYAQKLYLNGTEFGLGISNYFTDNQMIRTAQSIDIANNPSVEIVGKALRFVDNDRFWSQWVPVWATDGSVRFEMGIANYTTTGTQKYTTVAYKVTKDWSTLSFYSTHSNSNLGTSTNKWKTLNGINPGGLSLPSGDSVNIDATNWNFSWGANRATAPFDGYISIVCFGSALQINNETKLYAITFAPGSDGFICGLLPVSTGDSIKVLLAKTQTSQYEGYKFIKSRGNVS